MIDLALAACMKCFSRAFELNFWSLAICCMMQLLLVQYAVIVGINITLWAPFKSLYLKWYRIPLPRPSIWWESSFELVDIPIQCGKLILQSFSNPSGLSFKLGVCIIVALK